jgi:hypothetical protein
VGDLDLDRAGREPKQIAGDMIEHLKRSSSSDRRNTFSRSARVTIPTRAPLWSTTGRRLTSQSCIRRAAAAASSSGPTVTAGAVIRSAAVRPAALARSLRCWGRCCVAPTQGRLKADLRWDQIAKTSSSNATATRRLVGSATASS